MKRGDTAKWGWGGAKMRQGVVFVGAFGALFVMTAISCALGVAAPMLLPRSLTHWAGAALFLLFGVQLLWKAYRCSPSLLPSSSSSCPSRLPAHPTFPHTFEWMPCLPPLPPWSAASPAAAAPVLAEEGGKPASFSQGGRTASGGEAPNALQRIGRT